MPERPTVRRAFAFRWLLGGALLVLGLVTDAGAGLLVFADEPVWGLIAHVPAALTWALGVSVVEGRMSVAALVTGCLFPVFGPIGYSLVFGTSRLFRARRQAGLTRAERSESNDWPPSNEPMDPLRDLEIQPLVDVLRDPDIELKRAAIAALGRQANGAAPHILRGLLTDPDPDVRSHAAVVLSRLENAQSRALSQAIAQAREHPDVADHYDQVARLSYEYAHSGLVDNPIGLFHLTQARDALEKAISLEPARVDLRLELARVQSELDETTAAWCTLDRAFAVCSDSVDVYLLGMEMAFRERQWNRLVALAQRGRSIPTDDVTNQAVLEWWAKALPMAGDAAS